MTKVKKSVFVRIEQGLKDEFNAFCSNCGMTVSGAVHLLVKNTINKKQIPFEVISSNSVKGKYEGGLKQDATLVVRLDEEVKEEFTRICDTIGVNMSLIIKMFMVNCINTGRMPF